MSKNTTPKNSTPKNKQALDPSRIMALSTLVALWKEGGILEDNRFASLEPLHRARALRLTRETIRQEAGFDFVIKKLASQKPSQEVRAILHLGLYELLVDQAAPHGVLNEWVEISKSQPATERAAGFVNAVLRKANYERPRLNPTNQFGKALRAHLMTQYPSSTLDQINKVQSIAPPTDIRLRAGLDAKEWSEKLEGTQIDDTRSIRLSHTRQISELDGFKDGKWWVQDVAATVAVDQFGALDGQRVLDLCAAPGGKTLQLADAGAKVTAVELSKSRARRIFQNLERTGLTAEVVIADALEYQAEPFEAILLDAPCSATGTIRRHPDLRFDAPLERMKALQPLQSQLLRHAWSLLAPDGVLIYAVCSLLPEEGEAQIESFMHDHKDAKLEPITSPLAQNSEAYLRILPSALSELGGCDGFFIAKLKKAR